LLLSKINLLFSTPEIDLISDYFLEIFKTIFQEKGIKLIHFERNINGAQEEIIIEQEEKNLLLKLMCIQMINGFGLRDKNGNSFAFSLYPGACFINHSCIPTICRTNLNQKKLKSNSIIENNQHGKSNEIQNQIQNENQNQNKKFQNENENENENEIKQHLLSSLFSLSSVPSSGGDYQTIRFRALKDLSLGENITISYITLRNNTEERKKILSEAYFFECKCIRCLEEGTQHISEKFFKRIWL